MTGLLLLAFFAIVILTLAIRAHRRRAQTMDNIEELARRIEVKAKLIQKLVEKEDKPS